MKNRAGNRSAGALRPQIRAFSAYFSISWPNQAKIRRKTKNLNKGLHRTAHKLPKLRDLAMINSVEAFHYCACAPSGEA